MKNRTHAMRGNGEYPMRKLIVGMMGLAVAAIFLTSFVNGPMPDVRQSAPATSMKQDDMAGVPALMARVQANPKDLASILELGEIFNRAEEWPKSLYFWTKAIELDPANLGARYHRAYALVELQRFEESIPDYTFIIQANPESYQAHYYLGMVYKHGLDKPDLARKHLQTALDLKPMDRGLVSEIEKQLSNFK